MGITVAEVSGRRDLSEFIKLPYDLYAGCPHWTPPLKRFQRRDFSPRRNPYYQHAEVALFLARQNGQPAGRISAQVDQEHLRQHNDNVGFFGFFECQNDADVAAALARAAADWLRERGMSRARGPLSFSINGEAGILLQGSDSPPQIRMPYTPPYYPQLLESAGFRKIKDLYAWLYQWNHPSNNAMQVAERMRQRDDIVVRTVNMGDFYQEIAIIVDIFNEAWADNWGFVPMTPAESQQMAGDLKLIADRNVAVIVEINGRPAGMIVAVPNLNQAIGDLAGNLFPVGWLKLLWRVKMRRIRNGRVFIMGVRQEYRNREYAALPYLLIDEIARRGRARGYDWAELSWTLEDNHLTNNILSKMGCQRYKTYRIYEQDLI